MPERSSLPTWSMVRMRFLLAVDAVDLDAMAMPTQEGEDPEQEMA